MDEICGLKFQLSYVDMPQEFFWKFLHALTMSFLLLNLYFLSKIPPSHRLGLRLKMILPSIAYLTPPNIPTIDIMG